MHTTSGAMSPSHCSIRSWRTFSELTFQVAKRITTLAAVLRARDRLTVAGASPSVVTGSAASAGRPSSCVGRGEAVFVAAAFLAAAFFGAAFFAGAGARARRPRAFGGGGRPPSSPAPSWPPWRPSWPAPSSPSPRASAAGLRRRCLPAPAVAAPLPVAPAAAAPRSASRRRPAAPPPVAAGAFLRPARSAGAGTAGAGCSATAAAFLRAGRWPGGCAAPAPAASAAAFLARPLGGLALAVRGASTSASTSSSGVGRTAAPGAIVGTARSTLRRAGAKLITTSVTASPMCIDLAGAARRRVAHQPQRHVAEQVAELT